MNYAKYSNELVWDYKINPEQTSNKKQVRNKKIPFKPISRPGKQATGKKQTRQHSTRLALSLRSLYPILLFSILFTLLFFMAIAISQAGPVQRGGGAHTTLLQTDDSGRILHEYLFEPAVTETVRDNIASTNRTILFQKYRVQKNDTYEKISRRFEITMQSIYLANNIQKKGILRAGAVLTIPNQDGRLITVVHNDSIQKLAKRYGTNWERIVDVNNLESEVIHPGQSLFIPGSTMTEYERREFTSENYIWPVKGRITSKFGPRIDPFTGSYGFHSGIDIGRSKNARVGSIKAGKTAFVGWSKIYGNYIIIKHAGKITSTYAHLKSVKVKKGDTVTQRQYIGIVGSTGRSTAAHLHLEIRKNGKLVDPTDYLP